MTGANLAGASQHAAVEDTSADVAAKMVELNVLGPLALTRAALPFLLSRRRGRIVVVSSMAAAVPAPGPQPRPQTSRWHHTLLFGARWLQFCLPLHQPMNPDAGGWCAEQGDHCPRMLTALDALVCARRISTQCRTPCQEASLEELAINACAMRDEAS